MFVLQSPECGVPRHHANSGAQTYYCKVNHYCRSFFFWKLVKGVASYRMQRHVLVRCKFHIISRAAGSRSKSTSWDCSWAEMNYWETKIRTGAAGAWLLLTEIEMQGTEPSIRGSIIQRDSTSSYGVRPVCCSATALIIGSHLCSSIRSCFNLFFFK